MKDKFIEVEDMLFLECEPELLDIDKHGKSLVRYIQDDTRMGLYNKEAVCEEKALEVYEVLLYEPRDIYIAGDHHTRFEVIAKHCPEGSREWALWKMLNGEMVHRSGFPYKALNGEIYCTNSAGEIYPATSYQLWLENKAKDGWQLYKEPAKKPEIVAHKQHANCLVCGKEIKGLLDGHATVSIKRYSISSLYESTYSHYCGKCFLELGFDATERKLRNRQQPKSKPETLFDTWQCPVCGESISAEFEDSGHPRYNEEHLDENLCFAIGDHMKYSHTVEQPKYKVGDWVEHEKSKEQGRITYISSDNYDAIEVKLYDQDELETYTKSDFNADFRKLSPSEVIVNIGCLSGTVDDLSYAVDGRFWLIGKATERCPVGMFALLYDEMLDAQTRELVESLLKAQEEEK